MQKPIRVFTNFDEADAADSQARAQMTPQARVAIFFELRERAHPDALFSKDWREFIECLNSNGVEYLVVGALAVSWHGFARYSGDIDLLVRPSPANAERLLRALSQFGFASLGIALEDLTAPGRVVQLGYANNGRNEIPVACIR